MNIAIVPLVIVAMTLVSLIFIPPAAIGTAMAIKEISNFNCDTAPKSKARIAQCTTILTNDEIPLTGKVYHKDSEYIYMLTEAGAESIPINSVKSRKKALINPPANEQQEHIEE